MQIHRKFLLNSASVGGALALLLGAGCATSIPPTPENLRASMAYQPERSPVQLDATASVEANATQDSSITAHLRNGSGFSEQNVKDQMQARVDTLTNDIVASGLFARIRPVGDPSVDYAVKIQDEESRYPDWVVRLTIRVIDAKTGQELSVRSQEKPTGNTPYREAFQGMMAALKPEVAADLQNRLRQQKALAAAKEFQTASLADLLAAPDNFVAVARERNRALIAAKNQQLPKILRESKTDELSALVTKIEQTILDLDHESEVAKDRAQRATEANGDPLQIEELRGLTISYRERIELLKPIAAALKEEIANRNR
jgi:hypothetical protein